MKKKKKKQEIKKKKAKENMFVCLASQENIDKRQKTITQDQFCIEMEKENRLWAGGEKIKRISFGFNFREKEISEFKIAIDYRILFSAV